MQAANGPGERATWKASVLCNVVQDIGEQDAVVRHHAPEVEAALVDGHAQAFAALQEVHEADARRTIRIGVFAVASK